MKFGQSAGDEALMAFADVVRSRVRWQDTISRFGGECLSVLLPATTPEEAEEICARVVASLAERREFAGVGCLSRTVSAGAAQIEVSVDDTIRRAEMALFFAKKCGRNRLEMENKLKQRWTWRLGRSRAALA
jgi:diguanylate cyclase (GGDEF)-like protein